MAKKKPLIGRPPLSDKMVRKYRGWLPLSDTEQAAIKAAAEAAGKPLSVWAREILLKAAAKK